MSDKKKAFDMWVFDPAQSSYPVHDPHSAWAAWQAATEQSSKEIECLNALVAMQAKCIELFFNCFDILTDGPDDSDEAQAIGYLQEARELRSKLRNDTQATAEAYDREQAAKVLEEVSDRLYKHSNGECICHQIVDSVIAELRATKQVKE